MRQLFEICPDCNGNGFIAHMAANPTLDETIEECTRCEDWKGMVPMEPDYEAIGRRFDLLVSKYSDRSWRTSQLFREAFEDEFGAGIGDTDA